MKEDDIDYDVESNFFTLCCPFWLSKLLLVLLLLDSALTIRAQVFPRSTQVLLSRLGKL